MFWATVLMALREIRRNTLRSVLTMLGVVVGVASVITMVSLGRSATAKIESEISSMGTNLLLVTPSAETHGPRASHAPPLSTSDARNLQRKLRRVRHVAATATGSVTAVFGNENRTTAAIGTSNEYLHARGLTLAEGRLFSEREMDAGTPACILGAAVREALFETRNPMGSTIRIGRVACPVIGVLSAKGRSAMGPDQDDVILMPIGFFQRRVAGNDAVGAIFVSVEQSEQSAAVTEQIKTILRERRPQPKGREDNFTVHDMKELMSALSSVTGALTALLASIASVSLIVGGIGIMNIMLVSVTERTREIGVRLAIGAMGHEVMIQFLTEAVVLSMLGGALGAALGISGSLAVAASLGLPFGVHADIILLAFAFSASIGVLFGFLPARKAARLSPIAALAHE